MAVAAQVYWRCGACLATFLDPCLRPSAERELAEYRLHRNHETDIVYRQFLSRLTVPLLERLPAGRQGLDFGCGPEPVLATLLREAGHSVALYDPFFRPDRAVLERRYDFIACSEVVEHFHHPASEFKMLDDLLEPDGYLAVMTQFQTDDARFADWHYRRDLTHVVFYRAHTLAWLAERHGWRCEFPVRNVALMRKQ
jgi:SAM-dependent methyltransferase